MAVAYQNLPRLGRAHFSSQTLEAGGFRHGQIRLCPTTIWTNDVSPPPPALRVTMQKKGPTSLDHMASTSPSLAMDCGIQLGRPGASYDAILSWTRLPTVTLELHEQDLTSHFKRYSLCLVCYQTSLINYGHSTSSRHRHGPPKLWPIFFIPRTSQPAKVMPRMPSTFVASQKSPKLHP